MEFVLRRDYPRWIGRIIALLWGAFWTWFGIASGIGEGIGFVGTVMHALLPGAILLGSAFVAWKWSLAGSLLLIVEGLLIAVLYPILFSHMAPNVIVFMELTIALPPVVAGALILISRRYPPVTAVTPS